MRYKTIDSFKLKGKRVLLRSDLNSPIKDSKVELNDRIIESAKTIKELKNKKAKVVILAHQSRPGEKDFISLKQHSELLSKYTKVKFVDDIIGDKAIKEIEKLKDGEALLLENVRFLEEEFKPSLKGNLVKTLKKHFDVYFNDAFSVSHREQTSVVSFPKVLPSGVGRVMQSELEHLEKLNVESCLYILGGAKAEEDILLMDKGNVLSCGIFGHLCLIAKGHDLGAQNKFLEKQLKIIPELKNKIEEIESGKFSLKKGRYTRELFHISTPLDLAVKENGKRKEINLEEFPSNFEVYDIGEKTIKNYEHEIFNAKAVFIKGTAGSCEEKQFSKGTERILRAVIKSKAFSVLGGGHLTTSMKDLGISKKKFNFVSLSGGALLEYLAGKKLPGLEVLKTK